MRNPLRLPKVNPISLALLLAFILGVITLSGFRSEDSKKWQDDESEEVLARQKYFAMRRAGGPGKHVPANAYAKAVRQAAQIPNTHDLSGNPFATISWVNYTPNGLFYEFTNGNYISGRTNSFAFTQDPNYMWIASAGGGAWKTGDGGTSWTTYTDNLSSLACGAIAWDQTNALVLYLATGELNYSGDSYYGDGIFKSVNGGGTWTRVADAATYGSYFSQIAIDPTNSAVVYASGNLGVIKSTDSGNTWSLTGSASNTNCILIDPIDPEVLYTSTAGFWDAGLVQKSTDGGGTWTTLEGGLPTSTAGRTQLAMAPSDHNVLYASVAIYQNGMLEGLYQSTDAGTTWNLQNNSTNYLSYQGWYDNAVTVSPTEPNTVFVGGLDIYKSTDGGSTLTQLTSWYTNNSTTMSHADIHYLGFNNGVLYCGSDGGVYKSTDEGDTWSDMNATLSTLQMESADYDQTTPSRMYGGTQDNNKLKTTNGGVEWRQNTTGDGGYTLVDQQSPDYVYGAYVGGSLQRSTDFGETYNDIMPENGGLFYNPYEISPSNPQVIVYGSNNIWKTTSARTATTSSGWTQLYSPAAAPSAIAVSGMNDQRMYVGTWAGEVLCTRDNFNTNVSTFPGTDFISDLAIDPANDSICYATTTGFTANSKVYKTTDAGNSWINITGNLPNIPVNTIVIVPAVLTNPLSVKTLVVGTDLGCYMTSNEGNPWTSFNTNLPKVEIFDLKLHTSAGYIIAATHGRGVYMADIHQALPIQLASFTVRSVGDMRVQTDWQTISEINNYGFEVQKSAINELQYQTIPHSFVAGHGTTNEPHHYAFIDSSAQYGSWYYRLKQTDLDGSEHFYDGARVEILTGVGGELLPTQTALNQNYPNPFNPTTGIKYQISEFSHVTLKVYTMLGQEVATLVNENMAAGRYEVKFDATTLASGVYFYKLQTAAFTQTKKMLLMK